jgi:hypothetical protein
VNDVDEQGTHYAANAQLSSPNVGTRSRPVADATSRRRSARSRVPDDLKAKLVKEQQRKIAVAFGNGLQEQNPHALIEALDKGTLNDYLEPEDIKTLRSGGMVEIRRLEAADRQKRNQEKADASSTRT